ncbi:hypothetical protein CJP74_04995 [Psittacicella melopsittaci]|uniref:Type I restriction enzyme endonuclease subunit n=1 Tax=Psittacicella melopsittaci TaxID=2028576 RepID=A0A3A1Y4Q3_9GAMM|nr:HsdR family type I site-specific deoxyribonuclease [Psittacicella melopsittaci]RIY32246.1 hypothetical protein CJP74_04995 [Psittacicella melopsittaci]
MADYKAQYLIKNLDWQPLILKENSEEELWQNFRRILVQNNQDVLGKTPLSDNEFARIKLQITSLDSPFKAGQFIYGFGGTTQVYIERDDGSPACFTIFRQNEIGAGNSVYQVLHGFKRLPQIPGKPTRVFDTTLLINGLPLIQIEEKPSVCEVDQALNLMHQYIKENLYTGIFSTLQILIGMTPNGVKYMANTTADKFNKEFAFSWQRDSFAKNKNPIVHKWNDFARTMLTRAFAHVMAANFMIIDSDVRQSSLKVMRPYQVYATIAALSAVTKHQFGGRYGKLGYIWHTTGSGKTITSFKTAWLASRLPNVQKVVFVVDRVALTKQTLEKYRAYDPNFKGGTTSVDSDIHSTSNIFELYDLLKRRDAKIIITTLQKLKRLVSLREYVPNKINTLFIVDEAHRSTGSELFEQIQEAFPNSAWLGYTGTPVLYPTPANPRTTEDIFGPLMHKYIVNDAIRDSNVLGFKVDFKSTSPYQEHYAQTIAQFADYDKEEREQLALEANAKFMDEEKVDPSFYYLNAEHVRDVVADIFANWQHNSSNFQYSAILTTGSGCQAPSSPMVDMFYQEFKRVNAERKEQGLFTLNVAMTYSDAMGEQNQAKDVLDQAIADYNQTFGTAHSREEINLYFNDVIERISHKSHEGKYLDLVIVIDQLLTGFDAPMINTLYIDRPLRGAGLVQAYSRTNRITKMLEKPFGNIVHYRWPHNSKYEMLRAFATYALGEEFEDYGILEKEIYKTKTLAPAYSKVLAKLKEIVKKLRELTQDFTQIPATFSEQELMLELVRKYSFTLAQVKQYTYAPGRSQKNLYSYSDPQAFYQTIGISSEQEQDLMWLLTPKLRESITKTLGVESFEVETQINLVQDVPISYDYLGDLFSKYINQIHALRATSKRLPKLLEYLENRVDLSKKRFNKKELEFAQLWQDLHKYLESVKEKDEVTYRKALQAIEAINQGFFPGEGTTYPVAYGEASEVILPAANLRVYEQIRKFTDYWGISHVVDPEDLLEWFKIHSQGSRTDLALYPKLRNIDKDLGSSYKDHADPNVARLPSLFYYYDLVNALYEFADGQAEYI